MDAEQLCCLRNVAGTVGENALNVFPLHSRERWNGCRCHSAVDLVIEASICREYLVRVGWLAHIVIRAQLQSLHRRRNTSIAGQNDNGNGGVQPLDVLDQIQSTQAGHFQVEQDEIGTCAGHQTQRSFAIRRPLRFAASVAERPAKTVAECIIVIHHKYDEMIHSFLFRN